VLTKVTLTNFQSHKKLELDVKKFTTLTGGSNSGKTSVLRAILALVRNDSVNDYVRYGQKFLTVELKFDDGYIVEWIKGSGENKYVLTEPDGKSRVFDKVGSECPEEVKEVLKLGPVAIKASEKEYVNFHSQLEAPFLISATPGNVAKLFGELTSASQLYTAIGQGSKEVRGTNALKSTRLDDIKASREALDDFSDLEAQVDLVASAKDSLTKAKKLEQDVVAVEAIINDLTELDTKKADLDTNVEALSGTSEVSLDDLVAINSQISALSEAIGKVENLAELEKKGAAGIEYLSDAMAQDLQDLETIALETNGLEVTVSNFNRLDEEAERLTGLISSTSADILSMDTGLDELLQSVETCPECKQELSSEAREVLLAGKNVHATH
jgi:exonuclease SbcC